MTNHRRAGRAITGRDRKVNTSQPRKRILIVCEGEATEPNYFRAMSQNYRVNVRVDIVVTGIGKGAVALIKYAEMQRGTGSERFDEIWCVFDKDDVPDADFDQGISKIQNSSYLHAAWTNEAFELWFVLHFDYLNTSPGRSGGGPRQYYIDRLDTLLRAQCGRNAYRKSDPSMFDLLGEKRLQTAIVNARRLSESYPVNTPYHARKPATEVHKLVDVLRRYASEIPYNGIKS